jgi:hypothetical protein
MILHEVKTRGHKAIHNPVKAIGNIYCLKATIL